jgi:superfamily II DNA or RNA helicase
MSIFKMGYFIELHYYALIRNIRVECVSERGEKLEAILPFDSIDYYFDYDSNCRKTKTIKKALCNYYYIRYGSELLTNRELLKNGLIFNDRAYKISDLKIIEYPAELISRIKTIYRYFWNKRDKQYINNPQKFYLKNKHVLEISEELHSEIKKLGFKF